MNINSFDGEFRYHTMIAVSRRMLTEGLISQRDFVRIENYLNEKYHPMAKLLCHIAGS